jgi:DNA-directed RNA polymerase specialized sigma24 family protein
MKPKHATSRTRSSPRRWGGYCPTDELIRRVGSCDEQAAAWLARDFEPVIRRVLRARLRNAGARREFDSMDISQSVLASFFVRVAAGKYDLKEPDDLTKLLLTMTRNKVAEKMRRQHRLRRDSRRTVDGVEELALAGRDPTQSSVVAGKDLLEEARRRLCKEERLLVELRLKAIAGRKSRLRWGVRPGRGGISWPVRWTGSPWNCDSTSHD